MLVREQGFINIGNNPQGIFVIYFFKNRIRKPHAVHAPEGMVFFVIGEIFIIRFQNPEIGSVFFRHPAILAKHNPVLVLLKKTVLLL